MGSLQLNYRTIRGFNRFFIIINTSLPNIHNVLRNIGDGDRQYLEYCFEKKKWEDLGNALRFFNKPEKCRASVSIMCMNIFQLNKRMSLNRIKKSLYGVNVEFNKKSDNFKNSLPIRNINRYLEILDLPSQDLLVYDLPSFCALWYQRY